MSEKNARLESMLSNYITSAECYIDSKINDSRTKSYLYYYGKLPSPQPGYPPVVKKVIFEKVQAAHAQIRELVDFGRDIIKFTPFDETDAMDASIATTVTNKIITGHNCIEPIIDTLINDGLMTKNGVLKVTWEDCEEVIEQSFRGLSKHAFNTLVNDGEKEIEEWSIDEPPFDLKSSLAIIDSLQMNLQPEIEFDDIVDYETLKQAFPAISEMIDQWIEDNSTYSGTLSYTEDKSSVKICNVIPEDFLILDGERDLSNPSFVAHRQTLTASEIINLGFGKEVTDRILNGGNSDNTWDNTDAARNSIDGTTDLDQMTSDSEDLFTMYECYVRTSLVNHKETVARYKKSKLYQMYYCNGVLCSYEEVDSHPFFSWTPIAIPHKFFGMSMAESLFDQQDSATFALRASMQYLAFSTNPRFKSLPSSEYDLASFQANLPGSVVNIKKGDIVPFDYPRLDSGIFGLMDTFSQDANEVSGISNLSMGLSDEAMRSNVAEGTVALQMNAGQLRIKVYAKNLLNQCIKPAFKYAYDLYRKNSIKPVEIVINGKLTEIDPNTLVDRSELAISASLGKQDQIDKALTLLSAQSRIASNPQLSKYQSPFQQFVMEQDILTALGITDGIKYLTNPNDAPNEPTPQEQQQMQLDQLIAENKRQELVVKQKELEIKEAELVLKAEQFKRQFMLDQQVAADKQNLADAKLEFEQQKAADQLTLEEQRIELEILKTKAEIALESQQGRGVAIR